jgi:transcriptional regulator with XRE-family HTH domain
LLTLRISLTQYDYFKHMKKSLKDRVRHARLAAGLSQAALAEKIGIQRSAVAQWERVNGSSPTVENLCKVATIASVRFEWLATGRGPRIISPTEDQSLELEIDFKHFALTDHETRILVAMRKLTLHESSAVTELAESLALKAKHKSR